MGRITMSTMAEELAAQRAEMAALRAELELLRGTRAVSDTPRDASIEAASDTTGIAPSAPLSRRGVMLAAVGAAAGLAAASVRPTPVAAANGGAFILGQSNTAASGTGLQTPSGFGLSVSSSAATGQAITGNKTSTSGVNVGVGGISQSDNGIGVQGLANSDRGLNYGVYAQTNSPAGFALYAKGRMKVTGRTYLATPSGAPPASHMNTGSITFYLDQSSNRLRVKVKYSNGAIKYGSIGLG